MVVLENIKPAVVGLGYVGLPLAVEASQYYEVLGFDISCKRIEKLVEGEDATGEITSEELKNAKQLTFTSQPSDLEDRNFFIVTVPTPIDDANNPDFTPLINASEIIGRFLSLGAIVVFESTVYPGATEEICVPILEKSSGLEFNNDFFVGYSPERINPGDKERKIANIVKVTSGSSPECAEIVDLFYQSFVSAGTHRAPSIRVAEAAKVIENTQRDVNIALINELAMLFDKLDIDTREVLKAAGTKWNFLPFEPGLVGGHCIGVDPYYLTYKAREIGYHPEIISSGRRVNDFMPKFVAEKFLLCLVKAKVQLSNIRVLVLGVTFKENCPDIRNSKVIDLIRILEDYGASVDIIDPLVSKEDLWRSERLKLADDFAGPYHGMIYAVKHKSFEEFSTPLLRSFLIKGGILFDLKGSLSLTGGGVDLSL